MQEFIFLIVVHVRFRCIFFTLQKLWQLLNWNFKKIPFHAISIPMKLYSHTLTNTNWCVRFLPFSYLSFIIIRRWLYFVDLNENVSKAVKETLNRISLLCFISFHSNPQNIFFFVWVDIGIWALMPLKLAKFLVWNMTTLIILAACVLILDKAWSHEIMHKLLVQTLELAVLYKVPTCYQLFCRMHSQVFICNHATSFFNKQPNQSGNLVTYLL